MLRTNHVKPPKAPVPLLPHREFQDLIIFPADVSEKVRAKSQEDCRKEDSHSQARCLLETFL